MRQKEWKLIITFHTTSDAIAFEKACKETGQIRPYDPCTQGAFGPGAAGLVYSPG